MACAAEDLCVHEGVGPARAASLLACLELSRRRQPIRGGQTHRVYSRRRRTAVRPTAARVRQEHFWALALNTKNQLLKTIEVSVGSLNASIVHPRELFKDAVEAVPRRPLSWFTTIRAAIRRRRARTFNSRDGWSRPGGAGHRMLRSCRHRRRRCARQFAGAGTHVTPQGEVAVEHRRRPAVLP